MKRNCRKNYIILLIVSLFLAVNIMPAVSSINFSKNENIQNLYYKEIENDENFQIYVKEDNNIIDLKYHITDFELEEQIIENEQYFKIILGDESNQIIRGEPNLPNICRSVIIPDDLKMDIRVTYSNYKEYDNIKISPAKGDIERSINPDDVPYEFSDSYQKDNWYPNEIATLDSPYILRDFRGQVVQINPFQYNPVEQKLRYYTDVSVTVFPNGIDTENVIIRNKQIEKIDFDFLQIYKRHFLNYGLLSYNPVGEQGNMLVITYDDFWDSMLPFVQWKNMKGVPTDIVKVSEIGNANAIKTYISNYYNDNGLTFVLLVGDEAQVPSLYTSSYTSAASDPSYSYIVGNDNYQDLFVGRFSAENTDQVETQVERSIEYERDPQINAEWYQKGTGIASNLGPGDDNEYDNEHIDFIRDDLLAYTYTDVDQIYDPYATSSMVSTALNEGRSIINYCGHGSVTSWGSSGFSNTHINALSNDNMLPFICSVACNNGEFDDYTCFAEAWLRATNGATGDPTGAIGCFASTQSQSWDPPMDAEDEIVDILVETYPDNIRRTYGALCFEGTMHMMDEYGSSCYDETDSWTIFGDPSIEVRTDAPVELTVIHDDGIGGTSFEVTVDGVENALCAVSQNYELYGCAYTDENGHATIQFEEPLNGEDPYDLVVTSYNAIPYINQLLTNQAPTKPYRPSGPSSGEPGVQYLFSTNAIDSDDDRILFMWDWGDGTYSDWLGPFNSGETATALHAWEEEGQYEIKVKAKDIKDAESDWSDPLPISMPKQKSYILSLLDIIEQLFPRLFSLIKGLN